MAWLPSFCDPSSISDFLLSDRYGANADLGGAISKDGSGSTVQGQQGELAYSTSRRSDSSPLSYYRQKANRCNAKGNGPTTATVQIMASLGRYTLVMNSYWPLSLLMQSDTRAALLASTGSGAG